MPNFEIRGCSTWKSSTLIDMTQLSVLLRRTAVDAHHVEEVAQRATRHMRELLVDGRGEPACALVRLFEAHCYADLPAGLQTAARSTARDVVPWPRLQCLTSRIGG